MAQFLKISAFVLGVEWGWTKYWWYSSKEASLLNDERKKNIEEIKKLKAEIAQLKGTPVEHGMRFKCRLTLLTTICKSCIHDFDHNFILYTF